MPIENAIIKLKLKVWLAPSMLQNSESDSVHVFTEHDDFLKATFKFQQSAGVEAGFVKKQTICIHLNK